MSSAETALRHLRSDEASERLEAARFLATHAVPENQAAIREALAHESVVWIKGALRRALVRIGADDNLVVVSSVDHDDVPAGIAVQVHAEALETTTAQLIHEIEPLVGTLKLAAQADIEDYDGSQTRLAITRIDDFLEALSRLRRAAGAPKMEEFDLGLLIAEAIAEFQPSEGISLQKAGADHCIVVGDKTLVLMSVLNGLRNAIEATVAVGEPYDERPITLTWGSTNTDCWVSILDLGIGFKGNTHRAFEIGSTTKGGHLGMGLAITKQSIESMQGRVFLVPNTRGTRFEIRWPIPQGN